VPRRPGADPEATPSAWAHGLRRKPDIPAHAWRLVQVCVVGGGVVGLTTAVSLLDAGHEVEVLAATRTPGTTSDVAAAIFYPFLAHPKERVEMWARASRQVFEILAEDPATGVRLDEIVELFTIVGPPAEHLPEPRLLTTGLPPGYASAWATRLPVIDMARYLPWLEAECRNRGGVIRTRRLERLVEAPGDVVVHCTGLGARQLVGDARIRPMRGQVARLANPGLTRVWLDQRLDHLAYVVPFPDRVVVGGTAEPDEWDDAPQSEVEALILRRGARLGCGRTATRCAWRHRAWPTGEAWCTTMATAAAA
jgi:D-amino-acid oxidase